MALFIRSGSWYLSTKASNYIIYVLLETYLVLSRLLSVPKPLKIGASGTPFGSNSAVDMSLECELSNFSVVNKHFTSVRAQ